MSAPVCVSIYTYASTMCVVLYVFCSCGNSVCMCVCVGGRGVGGLLLLCQSDGVLAQCYASYLSSICITAASSLLNSLSQFWSVIFLLITHHLCVCSCMCVCVHAVFPSSGCPLHVCSPQPLALPRQKEAAVCLFHLLPTLFPRYCRTVWKWRGNWLSTGHCFALSVLTHMYTWEALLKCRMLLCGSNIFCMTLAVYLI